MNKFTAACALAFTSAFAIGNVDAAQLVLLNGDAGTGTGLDDPTPKAPQGLNPGTTLGEQRRIAYQFAMDLWGSVLKSNVPINVAATFQPLTCTPTSAVLGSAGTNFIIRDFPNALVPGIWYHSALADALAGIDLIPEDPTDIVSFFNGDIGVNPDCLTGTDWYYGLDGNTPANGINFLNVVMHEISHGLGFSGFLNVTNGALGNFDGIPRSDAYTENTFDNVLNLGFNDPAANNAQRALTMRTPGRLVWAGNQVTFEAALVLDNRTNLRVTAPAPAVGDYEIAFADFGPLAAAANFPANQAVLADDGIAAASNSDGCETPFVNAAAIAGKYALIDRGTCAFTVKVKNAQLNGAVGVIIANNTAGVSDMSGVDATITIPSVMVSQVDGNTLRANQPAVASVFVDPNLLQGADAAGRARLYAPNIVAPGSTFSHYDIALSPNALMEPNITASLQAQHNVDLTPALFRDIGWQLTPGNAKLGRCDTGVDLIEDGGFIVGANVQAWNNLCDASTTNHGRYLQCIISLEQRLRSAKLISPLEGIKVLVCGATNLRR